jgi:hypothetical protein
MRLQMLRHSSPQTLLYPLEIQWFARYKARSARILGYKKYPSRILLELKRLDLSISITDVAKRGVKVRI